jgi:hypothetical protein
MKSNAAGPGAIGGAKVHVIVRVPGSHTPPLSTFTGSRLTGTTSVMTTSLAVETLVPDGLVTRSV